MKNTTQKPLKRKWTGPVISSGKFILLKWVNTNKQTLVAQTHYSTKRYKLSWQDGFNKVLMGYYKDIEEICNYSDINFIKQWNT